VKSIRLSLIVYFLLLLGLALGAVSLFVYRITQQTLTARKEATRQLLMARYEDRCQEERAKLDKNLYDQARTLASLVQTYSRGHRIRYFPLHSLGLLNLGATPNAHLFAPLWTIEMDWNRVTQILHRPRSSELLFNEELLARPDDGHPTEYFQVNAEWGSSYRSRSMGGHTFAFNRDEFYRLALYEYRYDEVDLGGVRVRRVKLKAPISRFKFTPSFARPPGPRVENHDNKKGKKDGPAESQAKKSRGDSSGDRQRRGGQPPPEPPDGIHGTFMGQYVQYACDTGPLEAALAAHKEELGADQEELDHQSAVTLASLRNRLLGVSLGAFALAVLGSCWLVGVGLSPLRRLSDAVSQVSERDFRLSFDEAHLPGELRPIIERLTETLGQLQKAFRREKQAAADISHELRTPLAALITTIEVTLRKPRQPEDYRETLGECLASGKQMCQLVERLLALARLDAQVDRLRPQSIDAADLADECAALVRPLAEERHLALRVHRNGPAQIQADPAKLREVVTNLLHNAIQYNRPDGSIDLKVERSNGHLVVEVADTGIGIPPESREQIFERFYRADPSRHAEGLHAGLGLAIVKGFVDLMGGSIAVESAVGQGSTFRVLLPAR
jgi:two-component system, OmpR family, heavy metal sensor histidine kinase CusS